MKENTLSLSIYLSIYLSICSFSSPCKYFLSQFLHLHLSCLYIFLLFFPIPCFSFPSPFSNLMMSEYHSFNEILDTDMSIFMYICLMKILLDFSYICASAVTKKNKRPCTPWFTDELGNAESKKNAIHNDLRRDRGNILLLEQYRNMKKQVKSLIQLTKKDYYLKGLTNNKKRTQLINGILSNK